MQEKTGPEMFALIPESAISHKFVENELKIEQFNIWMALVQRFNPQSIELGRLIV